MNRANKLNKTMLFGLLFLGLIITACSPTAEKLNKEGNDAYANEAYLDALAAYEAAQIESPELAEPYYNAANTLYREGAYQEAMTMMQEALKYAGSESLEQHGYFNNGNSSFNLQAWEEAVAAYTEALLRNPGDQEAKYNLELALQQMQQQQQQQEQEQEQEQQEEQNQEQEQSQEGENQEDQQDQSQDGPEQQDQNQEGEEQQDEQPSEDEDQQQDSGGDGQDSDENEQEQERPSQMPQPGQRMTAEQARQLLAAIAENAETLQERLGQIFIAPPIPPTQDW